MVLAYAAHAGWRGEVSGRWGPFKRSWTRTASPAMFWSVVVAYGLLGLALLTVF